MKHCGRTEIAKSIDYFNTYFLLILETVNTSNQNKTVTFWFFVLKMRLTFGAKKTPRRFFEIWLCLMVSVKHDSCSCSPNSASLALFHLLDQLYPGQNIIISKFQVFDKKEKSEPLAGFFRILVGYL